MVNYVIDLTRNWGFFFGLSGRLATNNAPNVYSLFISFYVLCTIFHNCQLYVVLCS